MKAAFIVDVTSAKELAQLSEVLSNAGYSAQMVSRFGIDLGNDEVTEEKVSIPLPRRSGRVAELQEVEVFVRGVQTSFDNPDERVRTQRGESYLVRSGEPRLNITLELQAPFEDQKILSLLQRVQMSGIVALRNVER